MTADDTIYEAEGYMDEDLHEAACGEEGDEAEGCRPQGEACGAGGGS